MDLTERKVFEMVYFSVLVDITSRAKWDSC